jgi:hypothetical protein
MERFVAYATWSSFLSLAYWGAITLLANWVMGRLPEAAPLLEEVRHYGWMGGIVLGLLTAAVMV